MGSLREINKEKQSFPREKSYFRVALNIGLSNFESFNCSGLFYIKLLGLKSKSYAKKIKIKIEISDIGLLDEFN